MSLEKLTSYRVAEIAAFLGVIMSVIVGISAAFTLALFGLVLKHSYIPDSNFLLFAGGTLGLALIACLCTLGAWLGLKKLPYDASPTYSGVNTTAD